MKKLLMLGSITSVLLFGKLHAETRDIVYMSEVLPSITYDTLVIFDLDDTVISAAQSLGADTWYKYSIQKEIDSGVNPIVATERIEEKFIKIQNITGVVPTESYTPLIIKNLQDQGIKVIALTARPMMLSSVTRMQLKSVGVDFSLQPLVNGRFFIGDSYTSTYEDGIAFVGPFADKGKELLNFFKQIRYTPTRIVFIDDTLRNIVNMEKALINRPYPHISFHYNFMAEKGKKFDPILADFQWTYFSLHSILLNDTQAEQMLNTPIDKPVTGHHNISM